MIKQTQQFLIFGHPVKHSLSPLLYKNFAKQFADIQLNYKRQLGLLEPSGFECQVKKFFARSDSTAVNITAPFKQRAFKLVDVKTQRAQEAGSVNSIFKLSNGDLEGDNTDGVGLLKDIQQNQNFKLINKNILILGTGGAVGGVLPSLIGTEPSSITVISRTLEQAEKFKTAVSHFSVKSSTYAVPNGESGSSSLSCHNTSVVGAGDKLQKGEEHKMRNSCKNNYPAISIKTYDALNLEKNTIHFDLIINATPLSLSNQLPDIRKEILSPNCLCYDMVYKREYTVFTRWAEQQGAQATDGLGMLIEQGVENFYRWFGVKPDASKVFLALRERAR